MVECEKNVASVRMFSLAPGFIVINSEPRGLDVRNFHESRAQKCLSTAYEILFWSKKKKNYKTGDEQDICVAFCKFS